MRSRSHDGEAGYDVLTPFVLQGGARAGSAILVDRGWVPYRDDTPPIVDAPPPEAEDGVRIEGLLMAPEHPPAGPLAGLAAHDPPTGPLSATFYTDVRRLAAQMPYALVDATLRLSSSTPAHGAELPLPLDPPVVSNGPHLSYAVQWFSFTLIALVGYTALMMRMSRAAADEDPASGAEPRRRRGPTARS